MKLIELTKDHYVIVDDSEIKLGNIVAEKLLTGEYELFEIHTLNDIDLSSQKKVTHTSIPIVGLSLIDEDELKELLGEVDVLEMADESWNKELTKYQSISDYTDYVTGFLRGYDQAIEDNKDRKYTEEDMRNAIFFTLYHPTQNGMITISKDSICRKAIQSLSKSKTSWEVEIIDGKLKLKP